MVEQSPSPTATPQPGSQAVTGKPGAIDALSALRAATEAAHIRLDSQLPLADADATSADYNLHLVTIDAWLSDIDRLPLADTAWPTGWALAQRTRRSRIAADLAAMPATAGRAHAADRAQTDAHPDPHPDALSSGFAWGVAYVVEGSQLGGQMLYRRLRDRLAPHPLHYLRADAPAAPARWPRFTAALRAALTTPADIDAARVGALWAFDSLTARFERAGALA